MTQEELVNELYVVDQWSIEKFVKLHGNAEVITKKAVLIRGHWIPRSLMATDPDGNLYVQTWFYDKELK